MRFRGPLEASHTESAVCSLPTAHRSITHPTDGQFGNQRKEWTLEFSHCNVTLIEVIASLFVDLGA